MYNVTGYQIYMQFNNLISTEKYKNIFTNSDSLFSLWVAKTIFLDDFIKTKFVKIAQSVLCSSEDKRFAAGMHLLLV